MILTDKNRSVVVSEGKESPRCEVGEHCTGEPCGTRVAPAGTRYFAMEASVLRSLRLFVTLLLAAVFQAAFLAAREGSPSRRATCAWRATHEARRLKRFEVPKPKARILAADYDWGTLQAEYFTQRAAA
ncbi:MAG: hypothetical protein LAO22_22345 [Acidobacteriia bacterium]|nr:hypothetical protein [Terriglobia bacterium]